MTLEEALAICADRFLSEHEVQELCSHFDGPESDVLDRVSVVVAKRYLNGEISYEVGDTFMNSVWGYSLELDKLPNLTHLIYLEFDSGEYHHSGDSDDVDPELKYTKPGLERVLLDAKIT